MKSIMLLTIIFFSLDLYAAFSLTQLGQRSNQCDKKQTDIKIVTYDKSLAKETKELFENDKLAEAIVSDPHCYRVGTEVRLFVEGDEIPYLGRALIEEIEIQSDDELLQGRSQFSKKDRKTFVKNNRSDDYGQFKIRVYEKVAETVIDEQFQRLPTCFPTYGDWRSFLVRDSDPDKVVKAIQSGHKKADIWNGTFNCYKIGVSAKIQIKDRNSAEEFGSVVPTKLYLTHYTRLSREHASALGESLSSLKKRLSEKKDVDGGYVTMVVYDYQEYQPEPTN